MVSSTERHQRQKEPRAKANHMIFHLLSVTGNLTLQQTKHPAVPS
jgi:hypothetical protein